MCAHQFHAGHPVLVSCCATHLICFENWQSIPFHTRLVFSVYPVDVALPYVRSPDKWIFIGRQKKPLEDILKSLLKQSPTLAALFLRGKRVVNPFKTIRVRETEKPFVGKKHPTHFKFKGKDYGFALQRACHINYPRISFETDAQNDYFSRKTDCGQFELYLVDGVSKTLVSDFMGPRLQNGLATLAVHLPQNCVVGDTLTYEVRP
jgi:hypothetical protein